MSGSADSASSQMGRSSSGLFCRRALVLHSEDKTRAFLTAITARFYETDSRPTLAEATEALRSTVYDLVIADATYCDSTLLRALAAAGLAGKGIFVSSPVVLDRVTKGLSQGHAFGIVYDSGDRSDLEDQLVRLIHPRSTARFVTNGLTLEAWSRGVRVEAALVDLSNFGCAIWTPPRVESRPLFPGAHLENIRIKQGKSTLLDDASGIVRHLDTGPGRGPNGHETIGFRVGVEFVAKDSRPWEGDDSLTTDVATIRASMEAALRQPDCEFVLEAPGDPTHQRHANAGEFLVETNTLRLNMTTVPDWTPGDVCHVAFERGGTKHSFWTSVTNGRSTVSGAELSLRVPRALSLERHRYTQRVRPSEAQPIKLSLESPFQEGGLLTRVLDISASGAAFLTNVSGQILPIGTLIPKLTLIFPDGATFHTKARVCSLKRVAAESALTAKCGVEFQEISSEQRSNLADYVVRCSRPEVIGGTTSRVGPIWSFLEETGFLYPEKLSHLKVDEVRQSMERLLRQPNDVFKAWLVESGQRISAHISAVRLYDKTWGIQHLAAAKSKESVSQSRLLNVALAEYFDQNREIEWLRICYRPTNPWPSRVFGNFAQMIADKERSELVQLSYLVAPTASSQTGLEPPPGYRLRRFEPNDLKRIETYFVASGRTVQLRATDLTTDAINLQKLNSVYQRLGLQRRREVLVAERGRTLIGFALAEVSSPGLNLSELTSSSFIYLVEEDPVGIDLLTRGVRELYRSAGRSECIIVAENDFTAPLVERGFEQRKEYCWWTWHRSLWTVFHDQELRYLRGA